MSKRTADSNEAIRNYHVVAIKKSRRDRVSKTRTYWSAVECRTCHEAFSICPAHGIMPRWPEVTYVERLKSMLAHDHAGKRKHRATSDLGA